MPKSKIILSLGLLVALFPIIGLPHSWESFLQVVFGLSIALISVMISIDRRLSLKARVQKRQARKRAVVDTNPEIQFGRRVADVDPKARRARFGRRASDVTVPIAAISEIPEIAVEEVESEATF